MFTEDYILRQIAQLIAVLARVAGLKKAGKYQEAFKLIDQTIEETFGLEADVIKQLDDDSLSSLVTTVYGADLGKLYSLANLLKAEGDILAGQRRDTESRQSYQRALDLFYQLSTYPAAGLEKEISSKTAELEHLLNIQE